MDLAAEKCGVGLALKFMAYLEVIFFKFVMNFLQG